MWRTCKRLLCISEDQREGGKTKGRWNKLKGISSRKGGLSYDQPDRAWYDSSIVTQTEEIRVGGLLVSVRK